ncbi:hypothetical protein CPB83DRAFT_885381 [Crepidotus variabilis]|uniref:Peptidase metallopeptidase domain-containing protein n=1 Tax=Crepidotus variabilis TaxID=179855 RepID=A0A9P6EAE3_9AGAR|nr:hypothetical protein CPB83DRAFT_885381 [Crepidotus variabilis]
MSDASTTREEIYNKIRIFKANVDKTDAEAVAIVDQEFRLVKLAVDGGMFPSNTNQIKLRGPAHMTTGSSTIGFSPDKAHLTMTVNPGGKSSHLYLTPDDSSVLTNSTGVSHVTTSKPSSDIHSDEPQFWTQSPTCAEVTTDHGAHTTASTDASQGKAHAMQAVFIRSDRLWANGTTLTYSFVNQSEGTNATNQQTKVATVIKEWEKYANLKFAPATEGNPAMIRIAFDASSGSWSYTGKENLGIANDEPTMNLGWVYGDSTTISEAERGVILHEFGHAIGLMHEHQSPARGEKITLKDDAVIRYYTETQGWTEDEVREQIINVYNASDISNYSELDTTSIMMYFMPAAMNVQNIKIPPNNQLSEMDKAFMNINYPTGDSDQFSTSLDVAGVPPSDKADIVKAYNKQDWSEVRFLFTNFCTEARAAQETRSNDTSSSTGPPAHDIAPLIDGCLAERSTSGPSGAQKGVATVGSDLWLPGDEITYSFIQGTSDATAYRKKRVKDIFDFYSTRANLTFRQIDFDPLHPDAKIRIYFGAIPGDIATAWSEIGKKSIGLKQPKSEIDALGGTVDTSMNFTDIVPKVAPTTNEAKVREMRTLYHEIGHSLGLKHEHASPYTKTTDKPDTRVSMATAFDENSVMLYADKELRASTAWESFVAFFSPSSTKYNHEPSLLDLAFLGAIYPRADGHVDDHFLTDLQTLGIKETKPYLDLRKTAFTYFGKPEFAARVGDIRDKLTSDLATLATAKAAKAANPARDVTTPGRQRDIINPVSTATTGSFLDELMKQLSAFFRPTSGQLFALQFPGRFLQQDLYAWDTNKAGIYGQFVKPTVVNESEFRLVDQLYNVGTVIGAPSGLNLSIVYEEVLNNLVPGIQQSQINFSKQQGQIRQWLMKDVPTSGWVKDLISSQHTQTTGSTTGTSTAGNSAAHSINPSASTLTSDITAKPQFSVANKLTDENKVNRMELAEALMQEYLSAKQAWELERDEMIKNASGQDMDALTRRLAHITAIREQQLASKHADAVVRGYSHAIRQYLGYMDIKTPAEALQDAKDSLRESAVSSLDGSMNIYPVQMQPIDWFQSLSTSFTMEDLTANPDLILQQIDSKSKQLDALNSRLAVLQGKPKVNLQDLQNKLDAAQDSYDRANADLTSTYTTNVISLAKACINANNDFVMTDFVASAKAAKIADVAFDQIETGMKKLTDAQLSVQKSSRSLTQLLAQKSLAEATDTTQEITETTVMITGITKDLNELTARLQSLRYKDGATTAVTPTDNSTPSAETLASVPLLVPDSSSGGSRWQDFSFSHEVDTKYSASSDKSSASTRSTSVSLFFGSYHSESTSASASSSSTDQAQSVKVEVGFRATLVTVDRGGWFQPQFFKQSAGFHSIDPTVSWSKWPENIKTVQDLSGIGNMSAAEAEAACNELNKYMLPAYPTGFVICKDITIKIQLSSSDIQKQASEMETYAATSAGILCFSTSSTDSSKQSDKAYGFKAVSDGCVIKIPGPQILGYILQFTDPDTTTVIPDTLPDGFLISDADYDSTFTPAHALAPTAVEDKDKASTTPQPKT